MVEVFWRLLSKAVSCETATMRCTWGAEATPLCFVCVCWGINFASARSRREKKKSNFARAPNCILNFCVYIKFGVAGARARARASMQLEQKVVQGWRLNGPAVFHSPSNHITPSTTERAALTRDIAESSKCAKLHNKSEQERKKNSGSGCCWYSDPESPTEPAPRRRSINFNIYFYIFIRSTKATFGCTSLAARTCFDFDNHQSLFSPRNLFNEIFFSSNKSDSFLVSAQVQSI